MTSRRQFGNVRRLPSGRYQASYWHEGSHHKADRTFAAKADATAWLATVQTDILRGGWIDPNAGRVTLTEYANTWLEHRPELRPTTRTKYRGLLDRNILPEVGATTMAGLRPQVIRAWWAELSGQHPTTAANAYRLLSTICRTAVADQVILRNPCQVKGAGTERAPERPIASIAEVTAAVEAADPPVWKLAILLAAWCQLRRGEILGLQREDVDPLHGTLHIRRSVLISGVGPPKTDAGVRSVAVPPHVGPAVKAHLAAYVGPKRSAWVFPGENGQPSSLDKINRAWQAARKKIGRPDLHLHDLRHSGLTWAAATGASTAELMRRAGHASPAAALRYQHATEERDQVLAAALGALAAGTVTAITDAPNKPSRTERARRAAKGQETQ